MNRQILIERRVRRLEELITLIFEQKKEALQYENTEAWILIQNIEDELKALDLSEGDCEGKS